MLVILTGILAWGRYLPQFSAVHVSRYVFFVEGMTVAQSQSTVQLVFSVCTAAGMFGAMLLCPFLFKRMDYKRLLVWSCLLGGTAGVVGYFIGLFTGFILWAIIPTLVLTGVPLGVINVVGYAMIGDCLDRMELQTGRRETALGNACQTFVNKLGGAFSTVMIIAMYMFVGLNVSDMAAVNGGSGLVDPTLLSFSVRNGMSMLVTLIPGVCLLLCCVPMAFYDLTGKNKEEMLISLQNARRERGVDL